MLELPKSLVGLIVHRPSRENRTNNTLDIASRHRRLYLSDECEDDGLTPQPSNKVRCEVGKFQSLSLRFKIVSNNEVDLRCKVVSM